MIKKHHETSLNIIMEIYHGILYHWFQAQDKEYSDSLETRVPTCSQPGKKPPMTAVLTPRLHNRERIPGKHSHLCPPNLQDRSPGMGKSPLFTFDEFPSEQHLHGKSMANSGIPIATFDDTRGFLNQFQSLDDLNERDSESSCSALAPRKVALEHPDLFACISRGEKPWQTPRQHVYKHRHVCRQHVFVHQMLSRKGSGSGRRHMEQFRCLSCSGDSCHTSAVCCWDYRQIPVVHRAIVVDVCHPTILGQFGVPESRVKSEKSETTKRFQTDVYPNKWYVRSSGPTQSTGSPELC